MKSKNQALIIVIAVLVVTAGTLGKLYLSGKEELRKANEFYSQKKFSQAVVHYERSIQWYIPGFGFQTPAAEGLWKTAEAYEAQGDDENALTAYRLLRGAFYSVRSFYTPGKDWIGRCNEKIATLMARKPSSSESDRTKSFEQKKSEALEKLTADKSPHTPWAIAAEIGFFGWVTCAFFVIFKGMNKLGRFNFRKAVFWGWGFFLFYGLWILGMLKV